MRCTAGSPNLEPHSNRRGKAKQEVMRETRQLEGEVRKLQELYQGLQRDAAASEVTRTTLLQTISGARCITPHYACSIMTPPVLPRTVPNTN